MTHKGLGKRKILLLLLVCGYDVKITGSETSKEFPIAEVVQSIWVVQTQNLKRGQKNLLYKV